MKIVRFSSKTDAEAEAERLISALSLPTGMTYGEPWQIEDGTWVLKVKENGSWPAIDIISGTVEDYEPEPE